MGLDSVELLMTFESTFAIEVPDADAEKMYTIQIAADYFDARITYQPKEPDSFTGLYNHFRTYFEKAFKVAPADFTRTAILNELLPLTNRASLWKTMETETRCELPKLRKADLSEEPPADISLLGITLIKRKPAITQLRVEKFIDTVFSMNYKTLTTPPHIASRYELERIIIAITSEKCGIPIEEIEVHHSFVKDLGID